MTGKEAFRAVQPPYAENRTYGGVGGCRGAIPGTRPDRSFGVDGGGRAVPKRASFPRPSPPLHGEEGDLLVNSQPGGLAEGSRWSFRAQGETTTGKPRRMAEHPGGVPDPARTCDSVARSNWFGRDESSTPCRGADICCAITRRPPPPSPAATSGCPLATLRVDPAGMSKLHGALGQRALPPNASRISIAALPRFA